jgi:hypothetical protein
VRNISTGYQYGISPWAIAAAHSLTAQRVFQLICVHRIWMWQLPCVFRAQDVFRAQAGNTQAGNTQANNTLANNTLANNTLANNTLAGNRRHQQREILR